MFNCAFLKELHRILLCFVSIFIGNVFSICLVSRLFFVSLMLCLLDDVSMGVLVLLLI